MANYYAVCVKPSCLWTEETLIDKRIDAHFYSIKYMQYYNKLMKCKIKKMSLYNICSRMNSGPFGSALLASQYVDKGVAFIRPLNCKDYIVDIDNDVVFISKEDSERLKSSKFSSGDLIFTKIGNGIGDVAIIPQKIFECNISGNLMGVKVKNNIDNYYVLTFLKSIYGQNQIWQGMMNSAKPKIDMDTLKSIVIPIPSPEIQKYIGDKVRRAEELREEAKRLKKEAEEIFNQNYEQIRKNDSKFEWVNSYYLNEDNIIPNFYKQYELLRDKKYVYIEFENIVESIKCGIPVRSDMRIGDIYPFYGASGVTDNIGDYNFDGEYLIVAQDGSIGSVNVARNKFWANNHVWVVKVKNGWDLEFLELYLNQYNYWISLTTGSVVPKVTSENLKKLLVPKINYEVQKSIGDKIREAKHKEQKSKALIEQAKQDVEDLIEGNFSMK